MLNVSSIWLEVRMILALFFGGSLHSMIHAQQFPYTTSYHNAPQSEPVIPIPRILFSLR